MGSIMKRGKKLYLRYVDADGTERTRLAKGATTIADARPMLAAVEQRIMKGELGIPVVTEDQKAKRTITVSELAERFLGDVEDMPGYSSPKIKSLKNYRRDARTALKARILPALGTKAAVAVTSADVERLRDELLAGEERKLAAASVVQTMAILSKLFAWGRKAGHIDCHNPVAGLERPKPSHSIDFLDRAEVGRLLAKAEDLAAVGVASWQALTLYPMVATAIYCGLRKGELLGLRWRDVGLDVARLDVNRSYDLLPKSGEARHVPLHPDLVRILRGWKERCPETTEALVFPVEAAPGRFRMGVKLDTLGLAAVLTMAKCHQPADGKVWHMLRHTFASHSMMSGASLYGLQRMLGHSTPKMTQRYAHLSPDHLASEVARLSFAPPVAADVVDFGEAQRRRVG